MHITKKTKKGDTIAVSPFLDGGFHSLAAGACRAATRATGIEFNAGIDLESIA